MDDDNNSTISKPLTKTSEDGVALLQNSSDPNQNLTIGTEDSAVVTEEDQTNSKAVPVTSRSPVDQDKPKDTILKNVLNENDPNSEDIELKWDDDSDIDESVLDDTVPGLIDSLDMSISMAKSDEKIKSVGDGHTVSKDNDGLELMDVDTSEIEEISNKIDELIKDDDVEACATTNIEKRKPSEEKSPKSNKDNDNIIIDQESPDSTPGKEITDVIEESMVVDPSNSKESDLKEHSKETNLLIATKKSSELTIQEKMVQEEQTCSSLEMMKSTAEMVEQLPIPETNSPITIVKEDNVNKKHEHEMDLHTSEVTKKTPDIDNVTGTKQSIKVAHAASKVVVMEQVISLEKSNLTESSMDTSFVSILGDKQTDAGNTAEIIREPDSLTEILGSESDALQKIHNSKLSEFEDDDHIIPSKEEEDMLLAEPTSTDNPFDAMAVPSHAIDPIVDTSDGVNDATESVKNAPKNSDHVDPDIVRKPTDAEEMVVDTSDKITEVKDNFAVPTENIIKDVEGSIEQPDVEPMVCEASGNPVDTSKMPKTIDTTSCLNKPTSFKEEVTESLTTPAINIQADDSEKAQADSEVSETVPVLTLPISSTVDALKNRGQIEESTAASLHFGPSGTIQAAPNASDGVQTTPNIEAMTLDVSDTDPKVIESPIPSTSTEAEKVPQDTAKMLPIAIDPVQELPDTSDTIQKSLTTLDEIAKPSDTVKLLDETSILPSNLNDNATDSAISSATPPVASDYVKELPGTSDNIQKSLGEAMISDVSDTDPKVIESPIPSTSTEAEKMPQDTSKMLPIAIDPVQELPDTSDTIQKSLTSLDEIAKSSDTVKLLDETSILPSNLNDNATDSAISSATPPVASDYVKELPGTSDTIQKSLGEAMISDVSDTDPKVIESPIPSTSTEAEKMPQDTSKMLPIAIDPVQELPDTSDTIQKSLTSLDEIGKSSDTVKLLDKTSILPSNLNNNATDSAISSATPPIASDYVKELPDTSENATAISVGAPKCSNTLDALEKPSTASEIVSIASNSVQELPDTSDIVQVPPTNLNEVAISSDTVDLLEKQSTASEAVSSASSSEQELPNTVQKTPTTLDTGVISTDSPNLLAKPSTSAPNATDAVITSATPETIKVASDDSCTDQKSPNGGAETIQVPLDITDAPQLSTNEPEKPLSPKPSTSYDFRPPVVPETSTDSLGLLSEAARPLEDTSDEVPEFTDSLGLLAESSGPMDEEEEPEMEEEDDADDDEEPEDYQDDESNHPTTADQSEDSNAQTSEPDAPNPTDIEISEDSFADKLGATEKAKEAEDMDVDSDFDKLMASVAPEKQKIVLETEQLKSPDKPDDSMDVDDAKATDATTAEAASVLRKILTASKDVPAKGAATPRGPDQGKGAVTPAKAQKLSRCSNGTMSVVNIVELGESSSDDDTTGDAKPPFLVPKTEEGSTDDAVKQESTVAKPAAPKAMLRLNTDELTIKTAVAGAESTLVIPEAKPEELPQPGKPSTPKFSLEVFSLDSDDEDSDEKAKEIEKEPSPETPSATASAPAAAAARCGNPRCSDRGSAPALRLASKRTPALCQRCTQLLEARLQTLTRGVMDLTPLLRLEPERSESELVEISDSESDEGKDDKPLRSHQPLGQVGAKYMEGELADMINETWRKYKLDDRLSTASDELASQMAQLEKDQLDINKILDECQAATDTLRRDLYAAFTYPTRQMPSIEIFDTLHAQYAKVVDEGESSDSEPVRRSKRPRVQSKDENPAKRPAIPLGFTGDDMKKEPTEDVNAKADDDNTDIKVIALSAEAAPMGLPALGTLTRVPVAVGMTVFAMKHAFGAWQKATVLQAPPKGNQPYTTCKVRFEHKSKTNIATVSARHLAYAAPAKVRLTIGTRVIALFSDIIDQTRRRSYYSGVVAEMPNPVNSYRYLVFFDDGYAQYVSHSDTRVVCECSPLVWEEVHPFSREFVHSYLRAYPERPMVRLHAGQTIKTEWNGKWWVSRVVRVDASLVRVHFEADNRYEWIYRGSTRLAPLYLELQAAEKHRARPLPRSTQGKRNMPYVEYTRFEEQESNKTDALRQLQAEQEIKRQRAVAKKSTTAQNNQQTVIPPLSQDAVMSRVVYYTPKAAVKPYKMVPHTCSVKCKRTDVLPLKELRTYNPLARPLLSGWERQLVRHKGRKEVVYRAPCGRRLRNERELHRYLRATGSDMALDLFDFSPATHCLAEFVLNRCLVSKKDLSHGKENVPVPCVNYYDTSLPEFCSYNTERTPTAGVPLNLDPDFLCGCDCEDDCQDKTKCNCWQMTLGGARTVGQDGDSVGYVYKRLLEPVPSGIYECNSRCKCKHTCLNRVAQHPLQLKLQVFKTPNRGWGIRALNDVPKGAFLCVYAGNLLTDATANLDGLNEGDEYLAELDYIEVVEQMKEGYEEDVPEKDKELDKASKGSDDAETDSASSSEDERKADQDDGDFRPLVPLNTQQAFSKRLRRRKKTKEDEAKEKEAETKNEQATTGDKEKEKGDCITISDDEEVREPSRFMAQTDMGDNERVSKYRSVRSLYGKDEACYIMDAKVQGNIGRYLNHSCCPNVFVQNVFVDTHDPRFPWVAFFALSHIRAGTELTWNYNYDVGSVPDKVLYCYCGAPNCRGRLL